MYKDKEKEKAYQRAYRQTAEYKAYQRAYRENKRLEKGVSIAFQIMSFSL